ncbi:hypothetical protein DYB25_002994 [Aphanomyces astaci]|uniref:FIST C-domain domain-containing protein n=2 Tax=Aphanomyces astaci TaxID=112090 RepID=A0A397B9P4_APHAT|nr:hypothetical protein DYB25_002994 [Aphanomyces astaci]
MTRNARGAKAVPTSSAKSKHKGKGGASTKRAAAHPGKSRRKGTLPFPEEVLLLVLPYLTWRDTYRVCGVSRTWQAAHEASLKHASLVWTSYVFQGDSWDEILDMLQPQEPVFATPLVPQMAWVVVSGQPHTFRRMSGWKKLLDVITGRHLLPATCQLVCAYSDAGMIGHLSGEGIPPAELQEDMIGDGMAIGITVGHLPHTSVTLTIPEKDEIKAAVRDIQAATAPSACAGVGLPHDTSSAILLSTNFHQSVNLVRSLHYLHPSLGSSVVGGLVSFTDRCVPLVYRHSSFDTSTRTWQSHLEPATNLIVGFSGRVRATPFVSLGFTVCSPILQCAGSVEDESFELLRMYDAVHVVGPTSTTSTQIVVDPLEVLRDLPSPHVLLHLYMAESVAALETFLAAPTSMLSGGVTRIEVMCDVDKGILLSHSTGDPSDHWPVGSYGVFCAQTVAAARQDFLASLHHAQATVAAADGVAVGALTFPCVARGFPFYEHPNVEADMFDTVFPNVPLTGVFVGGEIGPVAIPGGHCLASAPEVQQLTTCGALFYTMPL